MARTNVPKSTGLVRNPTAGLTLTWTAADTTNFNAFPMSGNDLLLVWNSGASAYTVTITSAPDPNFGRTKDITTESLAAGEIHAFLPQTAGWQQTDTNLYLQASNVAVKFAVVALP